MNNPGRWLWSAPDWPHFHWDLAVLAEPLATARRAQGRLEMLGRLLDPALTGEALAEVMKVEGISTSAIEGQTLNPASVAASVARHLGLAWDPAAPLDREAEALVGVMHDAVQGFEAPLSVAKLCAWQGGLFSGGWSGMDRITVGALRPGEVVVASGAVGREVVHFEGVPRALLEEHLEAFVSWFNASRGKVEGLLRAGTAHLWFVTLHPFEDGNGRLARILADLAIAQDTGRADGLLRLSSRILKVRKAYYDILQRTQDARRGMEVTPWLQWFLGQVAGGCEESERILQSTLAKAKFWASHRALNMNDRQRKVLNRMLDAGPGGFEGGMNARKYAALTHSKNPTPSRDLADLVVWGCLVQVGGGGRSTSYDLPWDSLLRP